MQACKRGMDAACRAWVRASFDRRSRLRPQDGKIVKEMSVPPEQRPEYVRHGQADVGVRNVGQLPPLVPLPGSRGPMAATGTGAGLARVIDDSFFTLRGKDLRAEGRSSAVDRFLKRLPHGWARVVPIPPVLVHAQDPLKR